jgi:hypothetical protein
MQSIDGIVIEIEGRTGDLQRWKVILSWRTFMVYKKKQMVVELKVLDGKEESGVLSMDNRMKREELKTEIERLAYLGGKIDNISQELYG